MKTIKLTEDELRSALFKLSGRFEVVAPVMSGSRAEFLPVNDPADIALTDELPYKSPKEIVLPRVERLLRFRGEAVEVTQDVRPVLLFGAKPCDLEALHITDEIFTGENGKYSDPFYNNRRAALTVVGMGCTEKKRACFCDERGTDKTFSSRCDVFVTPAEGGFLLEALTPAGEDLFDGTAAEAPEHSAAPAASLFIAADEKRLFENMPWKEYAAGCIGCGTCTYLCPTCHCFEFKDSENGAAAERGRIWDSCMYPNFTIHAGGHNPRSGSPARLRQRLLHKFVYMRDNFGFTACTGCGRCIRSCPGGLNIRRAAADVKERTEGAAE